MTESELRFALRVVTDGARAQAPAGVRREQGEGIQGLGLGEKITDGRATGSLALRVYVETKKPKRAVASPVPGRLTLPELGECPTDVLEIDDILRHLGLPHRRPRIAPARAPPQTEIDFDQTPHWDRESDGPAPPRNPLDPFDQSLPGDDGTWSA